MKAAQPEGSLVLQEPQRRRRRFGFWVGRVRPSNPHLASREEGQLLLHLACLAPNIKLTATLTRHCLSLSALKQIKRCVFEVFSGRVSGRAPGGGCQKLCFRRRGSPSRLMEKKCSGAHRVNLPGRVFTPGKTARAKRSAVITTPSPDPPSLPTLAQPRSFNF